MADHMDTLEGVTREVIASESWKGFQAARDAYNKALAWLKKTLETSDSWVNPDSHIISTNLELEDAQTFIRDNLDLANGRDAFELDAGIFYYDNLTREHAQLILDALATIWDFDYSRDDISEIAMSLSLCPLHFCDWAACFDDELEDCAAIRACFPHGHDT